MESPTKIPRITPTSKLAKMSPLLNKMESPTKIPRIIPTSKLEKMSPQQSKTGNSASPTPTTRGRPAPSPRKNKPSASSNPGSFITEKEDLSGPQPQSSLPPPDQVIHENDPVSKLEKISHQQNKPGNVLPSNHATRRRPGPASRTSKPSASSVCDNAGSFITEKDSIYPKLDISSENRDLSVTPLIPAPIPPGVGRARAVSLADVAASSPTNEFQSSCLGRDAEDSLSSLFETIYQSGMTELEFSAFGSTILPCLVDANIEGYHQLQNAVKDDHVGIPLNSQSSSIKVGFPQNLTWNEIASGVFSAICYDNDKMRVGYLRLENRTVKPVDRNGRYTMILFVIDGTVVVKSEQFDFNENGKPYLKSVELFEGCSFIIPSNAIYSLENWTSEEASIFFAISKSQGNN